MVPAKPPTDGIRRAVLHALNLSIEAFLRDQVPLAPSQVDIEFRAPDRDWSAKLTRPTLNLFLHEVRRSSNRSVTGVATRQSEGSYQRAILAPFVRVRYCVSLWTAEPADEHRVLGEVLSVVATAGSVPDAFLVEPLRSLGNPVELGLASDEVRSSESLWSGLGVAPRLALDLLVVVPVAPPLARLVPAPPIDVQLAANDQHQPTRQSAVRRAPLAGAGTRRMAGRRGVIEDLGRRATPDTTTGVDA